VKLTPTSRSKILLDPPDGPSAGRELTSAECEKDCHDSYYEAGGELRARLLVEAAKRLMQAHPVFRSKPCGGYGSIARTEQLEAIAAEDALRKLCS
jgi:hypothetical protein